MNTGKSGKRGKKHDRGYKSVLSIKEAFLFFLKKYINLPWVRDITVDDLEKIDKSFVTKETVMTIGRRRGVTASTPSAAIFSATAS